MTALTQREQVALAAAGVLLLLLFLRALRRRRQLTRRLSSIAARLVGPGAVTVDGKGGLERTLAGLEQAAQEGALRVSDAGESTHRMSFVLGLVAEGIVMCDEHGREVFRNEQAAAMMADASDDAGEEVIANALVAAVEGRPSTETIETFGPPRRSILVTTEPLDDGRRSFGGVAVLADLSERRRLDAVRRDFLTNVGERLVTPAVSLTTLASHLQTTSATAASRQLAASLHGEAARLSAAVQELAELSRIEAQGAPVRDPVPLHLVLAEAAEMASEMARAAAVTIDRSEPDHAFVALGDRRQLVDAVSHLLANAVSASAPGSSVTLHATSTDGWHDVVVADRGVGIPEAELDRIFERFYRGPTAMPGGHAGPGLGLAIVRHVAANHGGSIGVESEEGAGTTVHLRLPDPDAPGPVAGAGLPTATYVDDTDVEVTDVDDTEYGFEDEGVADHDNPEAAPVGPEEAE